MIFQLRNLESEVLYGANKQLFLDDFFHYGNSYGLTLQWVMIVPLNGQMQLSMGIIWQFALTL